MQWDEGAYHEYTTESKPMRAMDTVGECLVRQNSLGLSNTQCLMDYLSLQEKNDKNVYFEYERHTSSDALVSPQTDACVVFTGPSKHSNPLILEKFLPCVESYGISTNTASTCGVLSTASADVCQIPPMIWSGGSKNNVPVATHHVVEEVSFANREALALRYFSEAQDEAHCALGKLEDYVNKNLEVILFSGEGDSLHQMFDCMVQGPYARVDLWSRGSASDLPVPYWARDTDGQGRSRTLDVPCAYDKLHGDKKSPFTCGGETRRAVIKYFVRKHINEDSNGIGMTERLIREHVKKLQEAWSRDVDQFACRGSDGTSNFTNCQMSLQDNFVPPGLNVSFDAIPGSDVLKSITEKIWPYIQGALAGANNNAEFKLYEHYKPDSTEVKSWNWIDSGLGNIARDDGLYDSQKPVVNYSGGESGYPFIRETSIWDMCTGMISQVMFTMPMSSIKIDDHLAWTVSSVLGLRTDALKFDPTLATDFGTKSIIELDGLSMLERYVNKLLEDSFSRSPTFWHYAVQHVPSDSQVTVSNPTPIVLFGMTTMLTPTTGVRISSDCTYHDHKESQVYWRKHCRS
jgi:hypothetical protein